MITPINGHIVAKLIEKPKKEGSLILLPKEGKMELLEVVAIPDNEQVLKIGDKIMVYSYDYNLGGFDLNGKKLCYIKTNNILAIINE